MCGCFYPTFMIANDANDANDASDVNRNETKSSAKGCGTTHLSTVNKEEREVEVTVWRLFLSSD
jgi:hypothetical protein